MSCATETGGGSRSHLELNCAPFHWVSCSSGMMLSQCCHATESNPKSAVATVLLYIKTALSDVKTASSRSMGSRFSISAAFVASAQTQAKSTKPWPRHKLHAEHTLTNLSQLIQLGAVHSLGLVLSIFIKPILQHMCSLRTIVHHHIGASCLAMN